MVAVAISLTAGLCAWTLVEYSIHGGMSHVFRTFAAPLHNVHHRDPRAVFTLGAWLPAAALWLIGAMVLGFGLTTIFYTGRLAGFIAYEIIHYRFHFAAPMTAIEARLRERHLAHHHGAPDACFGVTTRLWDIAFGTEPDAQRMEKLGATAAAIAPLKGSSN